MNRTRRTPIARSALLLSFALALAAADCSRRPAPDPAWAKEVEAARAKRVASLTREDGWLSLVGLAWLTPGENAFGSDPAGAVVLAAPGVAPRAGVLVVGADGRVSLRAEAGAGVAVNGTALPEAALRTDRDGRPDVVTVGRLRLAVIQRGDRFAVRVRDPESAARKGFRGIDAYPLDARLRVRGTLEPFAALREVEVPSAHGPAQKMSSIGVVRFAVAGRELALEPFVDGPGDDTFFFVFRDRTAGDGTYGGGRFLYAPAPKAGSREVVLDFNLAVNPPCAFTPYATCPLPLPENDLPVRIEAGEKAPGGH